MEAASQEQTHSVNAGSRKLLAVLTLLTTGCGTWAFAHVVGGSGWGPLSVALIVLLTVLLVWIALSFWMATAGFIRRLRIAGN